MADRRVAETTLSRNLRALDYNYGDLCHYIGYSKNKQKVVATVSDVLCARTKYIDQQYLTQCKVEDSWSTLNWPKEMPPRPDSHLWKEALYQLAPRGQVADNLGRLIS